MPLILTSCAPRIWRVGFFSEIPARGLDFWVPNAEIMATQGLPSPFSAAGAQNIPPGPVYFGRHEAPRYTSDRRRLAKGEQRGEQMVQNYYLRIVLTPFSFRAY